VINLFKTNEKVDLNIIKQAILDYRSEGENLMFELGKKYNLDIQNTEDYEKLISKNNENIPRKGKLSGKCKYVFHGRECGFHIKQKRIEVVLTNAPEFGHIDSWFLISYMNSIEKYRKEIDGMDSQELQKLINKLYDSGEVENIE
jgi:hypothetical protein